MTVNLNFIENLIYREFGGLALECIYSKSKTWSSLSPSCRLYPPGRSPSLLRDGVEPEAGVDQSRALPPGCMPYGPEAGPGSLCIQDLAIHNNG